MRHPVILAGMMVVLAGCSSLDALRLADRGPSADLDVARLEADAARETDRVRFIAARAGLTQDERLWAAPEWRRFGIAAFTVAKRECDDYLEALRRTESVRRATARQLNIIGTSTAAFLGIGQVAGAAVAATATAFGLVTATADNLLGTLVYALPASAVRGLVETSRQRYEDALTEADWADRARAFRNIAQYVSYCLPVVIEANAAAAVGSPAIEVTRRVGDAPPQLRFGAPVVATGNAGVADVRAPATPAGPVAVAVVGAVGQPESTLLTAGNVRAIRANLCLPARADANLGAADLRDAIAGWRSQTGSPQTGGLTGNEMVALAALGPCLPRFRSRFEMDSFAAPADVTRLADRLRQLGLLLVSEQPARMDDPALRRAIRAFNQSNNQGAGDALTAQGFRRLRELTAAAAPAAMGTGI